MPIDAERVRNLVLVRLLLTRKKPINENQLLKQLSVELSLQLSEAGATEALQAAMKDAERRSLMTVGIPPKGKTRRPQLTDDGRQHALAALGLKTVPPNLTWTRAR